MSKWIMFQQRIPTNPHKVTKIWDVISIDGDHLLGRVSWYSGWRRYCFTPAPHTIFEQDCLRDIANFIETETKDHKAQRKAEKNIMGGIINGREFGEIPEPIREMIKETEEV